MNALLARLLERLLGRLPIGWLQLVHNRGRLGAAIAGVAFANVLVFVQLGFLGALVSSVRLPYDALAADVLLQAADANTLQDGGPLPRQRLLESLAVPGVASATAVYYARMDWKQPDGTVRNLDVLGVDPRERAFRLPEVEAARAALTLSGIALIDRGTRNVPAILFEEVEAGRPYRIEGNGRSIDIIGTFRIGGGFGTDGYLLVSDQTFLKLFRTRAPGAPNLVLVRAAAGTSPAALADQLRAALPGSDTVVRTVAQAAAKDQGFQTTQKPVGIVFGFGVVIGALVGLVIVYQVLATDVADHLKEYATFKAIGYRQSFFLSIVFEEALVLALLGFVPGSAIALGIYAAAARLTGLPVAMTAGRLTFVFVGTLAMCMLSGAIATRRLARAEPAELF